MKRYESYQISPVAWNEYFPSHWKFERGKILYQKEDRSTSPNDKVVTCFRDGMVTLRENRRTNGFTESIKESGYQGVKKGDLVIHEMDAFAGSIGVSDSDGKCTPVYSVCTAKGDTNNHYYAYLLREIARRGYILSLYKGIRERSSDFRFEIFAAQFYPVPPRAEQDRIVQYLDWKVSEINRLLEIAREENKLLKELIDVQFQKAKSSTVTKLKRVVTLEYDPVDIEKDNYYQKTGMFNRGRGIFRRNPILGSEMGDSKFQKIHSERIMISGQFAWEAAVYITTLEDETGVASHRYYLLKPVDGFCIEYIWAFLMSDVGQMEMNRCSRGAAGRNRPLNIKEMLNVEIPLPEGEEELSKLVKAVRTYMTYQSVLKNEESILHEFKNCIISDAVTGQIDVRDIEIPEYEYVEETADIDSEETDEFEEVDQEV